MSVPLHVLSRAHVRFASFLPMRTPASPAKLDMCTRSLRLLLLPLLRREALRRPSMNLRNLLLQNTVNESVSRKRHLLRELRGNDRGVEHLTAATCGHSLVSAQHHAEAGVRRRGAPDISSISTCVASRPLLSLTEMSSAVTPESSAIAICGTEVVRTA